LDHPRRPALPQRHVQGFHGLIGFLRDHLGKPIPSPAVLGQITSRFRDRVGAFAEAEGIR
jgi:hypothetical protein